MKKSHNKKRNIFLNWLIYNFLIKFVEQELSFQIQFVTDGKTVSTQQMYVVPQIGSKVEIIKFEFTEEITKLFLVQDIIYSSYGSANKAIGRFIE
ncbi:hypothetical protein [Flavobacterium johnsoniae]|uniref:Uncharacterized protein n=1 Tax=Flavobacterium johnsoniae TaxID=986 RepID=A0A1M5IG90_FLAJO|nr:hypothetical protein [Flavobacterium johnsoniae]SHG27235.1 hypothetical protein SAMN05444388_10285 [Flavobacterium johnsoniae]